MRLLLDAVTLLWAFDDSPRLRSGPREAMRTADELFLSVVSCWELAIKVGSGKLDIVGDLGEFFERQIATWDLTVLDVTLPHALGVQSLPLLHKDPFDRMLVAQARHERLAIVTADPLIRRYDVEVVW